MDDYRDFTKEEEKIYDSEIKRLQKLIAEGATYNDACNTLTLNDPEMRQVIADDLLKVLIAELHYGKKKSFEQIAESLGVAVSDIQKMHRIMIEDVMQTVNQGFDPSKVTLH
jgi:hypothetical protein